MLLLIAIEYVPLYSLHACAIYSLWYSIRDKTVNSLLTIIEQQIVICCFRFGCIRRVYQSFDIPPFEIENILQCYLQTQLSFTFWWQFIQNRLYANVITRYLVNYMGRILLWVVMLSRDSLDGCFRGQWNTQRESLHHPENEKKVLCCGGHFEF